MGEDQVNLLYNSFFPDPCQSCTPCNSRAVRLQALVSATRKMPEAINAFSDELPKSAHAGAERSLHTETGGTWRVAVGCAPYLQEGGCGAVTRYRTTAKRLPVVV